MDRTFPPLIRCLLLWLLTGCDAEVEAPAPRAVANIIEVNREFNEARAETLSHLQREATDLRAAIELFLDEPQENTLTAAREQWRRAHRAIAAHRYFLDPEMRDRLDAWPIQPGFLDSIPGYPDSGIINDETIEITMSEVIHQHGITDASEASLGFHPLEFLLFGREPDDYVVGEKASDRRRQLLSLTALALTTDIRALANRPDDGEASADAVVSGLEHHLDRLASNLGALRAEATSVTTGGHAALSDEDENALYEGIEVLRKLTGPDSAMADAMASINAQVADNYQQTLVIASTRQEVTDRETAALLPLIALRHQVDDLIRTMNAP